MNLLKFIQAGGFPMDTNVLDQMQNSYKLLNALGTLAGDRAIIQGCTLTGSTVSNGVIYLNGEVLEFRGGIAEANIIIIQEVESKEFENGSTNEVHYTRYATFGVGTVQYPWLSFKRGFSTTLIENALLSKTDSYITDGILTRLANAESKLNSIQWGAEVNVQADMSVTNVNSDAYVKNKPAAQASEFLYKGFFTIGDPLVKSTYAITFPSVGTSNYAVLGSLEGRNGNRSIDIGSSYVIFSRTQTSFILGVDDIGGVQALDFNFALVAK